MSEHRGMLGRRKGKCYGNNHGESYLTVSLTLAHGRSMYAWMPILLGQDVTRTTASRHT